MGQTISCIYIMSILWDMNGMKWDKYGLMLMGLILLGASLGFISNNGKYIYNGETFARILVI